tara:strand:+ start:612 stop:1028 length:417 start_codon:yes stop_codon:yes gene_type:complete
MSEEHKDTTPEAKTPQSEDLGAKTTSKNLKDYGREVFMAKNDPEGLADLHLEISMQYASLTEDYVNLKLQRANFWQVKEKKDENGKKPSDKAVENMWLLTPAGGKMEKIKYYLDGMEKLIGAIKTASVVNSLMANNKL